MSPAKQINTPRKITNSLAATFVMNLLGGAIFFASATDAAVLTKQSLIEQGAQISQHRLTGQTYFIGTQAGNAIALPGTGTSKSASAAAMDALTTYGKMFGLSNPASELKQKSLKSIANGRSVVRYQQNYNGIPVIGGEMIVNLSANNRLLSINGEVAQKLLVPTSANITALQASNTALSSVARWHRTSPSTLSASTPILSVYDPRLISPYTSPASLVWRIDVSSIAQQPIRELVLIDALNGSISLHFNQIDTAMIRQTYTANETTANPGTLICNEADPACTAGDTDAQNAHQFAKDTYDFYFNTHARDSIDNAGSAIISTTHWNDSVSCPNAFWDGSRMVYCSDMVVDDVVAHELTHGVTENESNLFYFYQSGAINESLSDIWGEFVDLGNGIGTDDAASRWLMGEDLNASGMTGAIRSMKDPTIYSDPDRMSSAYYHTAYSDNGGVHINSGINNKAAYLMVDGDTFNGKTVTGIGITKTARIYYEVQTNLLTSGSNYLDLYNALYQGCQNLIGTSGITADDCIQVRAAADAVEMNQQPSVGFNPDAAMCPTGQGVATTIFSSDFEGVISGWLPTQTGTPYWVPWNAFFGAANGGPNATSGIESYFGYDDYVASRLSVQTSVTLPVGSSYLHFHHDYDLDDFGGTLNDGAVLEYSTDLGSTWINAASLIDDGKTTDGVIATTGRSNPFEGEAAFGGLSHGYVSTRLDLTSLAGQLVYFRWSVATDNRYGGDVGYYGWWIDDVSIHTCQNVSTFNFSSPTYTVSETGNPTVAITVIRTGSSVGAASVNYAANSGSATAGSDYTATTGTLNWIDGDTADKTFNVSITDDTYYDGTETIDLVLSSPTNADVNTGAELGATSVASLAITDDDASTTVSFSSTTYPVDENGTSVTIFVNRSGNTNGPASIDYSVISNTAISDSDFTATSGTLNWPAGDAAAKTFTIPIIDDTNYEGDETASLTLTNPVSTLIGTSSATLTIIEDDIAPTISFNNANYSISESSGSVTITLSRGITNTGAISVDYSVTGGSATSGTDFVSSSGTLSWASGDGADKTFAVSIIDDSAYEANETVNLALTSLRGAVAGTPGTATLTITNDDSKPSGGGIMGWPFLLIGLLWLSMRRRFHNVA